MLGSSSDHIPGRCAGEGRADESTGCLAAYGGDSQGSNCHGSYIAECFSFVSVAMKNHCCVKVKQLLLVALWYLVVIVASIDMKLWLIVLGWTRICCVTKGMPLWINLFNCWVAH